MQITPSEIAFDFDGVIADTFRLFVSLAKSRYNVEINYEDITDYEFLNVIDMDREHAFELIDILTNYPHELDLMPNRGAVDVLTRMASMSPLLCVTARPFAKPIEQWFEKHLPRLLPECIQVAATGISSKKLDILSGTRVRYFIDDRLDTCVMLADAGITPILYTQPWNQRPHSFHEVGSWEEIASLIDWNSSSADTRTCLKP
ncbi:MAG TPA: haloacid dehalogenase [Deltaproteobacteria bacterium]|nr:haloacid dehalogenase [Deltaproteobacteria bacterium]